MAVYDVRVLYVDEHGDFNDETHRIKADSRKQACDDVLLLDCIIDATSAAVRSAQPVFFENDRVKVRPFYHVDIGRKGHYSSRLSDEYAYGTVIVSTEDTVVVQFDVARPMVAGMETDTQAFMPREVVFAHD